MFSNSFTQFINVKKTPAQEDKVCNNVMKKMFLTIVICAGMISSLFGQTGEKLTPGQIKEMKEMFQVIFKVMMPEQLEAVAARGVDEDEFCKVIADVSVDFIVKWFKGEAPDMGEYMKFVQGMFEPTAPVHNEFMAVLEGALKKKFGNDFSFDFGGGGGGAVSVRGPASASVPALSVGGSLYKVKVAIGTTERYYVLDSGSSSCSISTSYARELRRLGILTDERFVEERTYTLADGSPSTCEVYALDGVKIGAFTLDNVEFSVQPGVGVDFLLGKNVLDAFASWQIKKGAESTLELVK
jgi:hypothetical protein